MTLWALLLAPPAFTLEAPDLEIQGFHGVRIVMLQGPFRLVTPEWVLSGSRGRYVETGGIHEAWDGVSFVDTLRTIRALRLLLIPDRDTFTLFRDSVVYRDSSVLLHTDCLVLAGKEARFSPVLLDAPRHDAWVVGREGWLVEGGVYVWGLPLPEIRLVSGRETLRVVAGVLRLEESRVFADSAVDVIHPAYRALAVSLIYEPEEGRGELLGDPAQLVYGDGEVTGRRIRFILKDGRVEEVEVEENARLEQENLELTADRLVAWFAPDSARVVRVEALNRVEGLFQPTSEEDSDGDAESP